MDHASPPEDAYSRVTNPERFRPLHAFADAVVDALLLGYEIESVERDLPLHYMERNYPTDRSIRIVPTGGGAPVVIWWTPFPGLHTLFGDWDIQPIPHCGCDACDDDPYGLFEEFHRRLWAVVNGDYQEWIADGARFYGTASRWSSDGAAASGANETWRSNWQPWKRLRHW